MLEYVRPASFVVIRHVRPEAELHEVRLHYWRPKRRARLDRAYQPSRAGVRWRTFW